MVAKSKQAPRAVEPTAKPLAPLFKGSLTFSDPSDDNPMPATIQVRVFKVDGSNPRLPDPHQDAEMQEAGWIRHAVGELDVALRVVF
jgi:hypothetical protein